MCKQLRASPSRARSLPPRKASKHLHNWRCCEPSVAMKYRVFSSARRGVLTSCGNYSPRLLISSPMSLEVTYRARGETSTFKHVRTGERRRPSFRAPQTLPVSGQWAPVQELARDGQDIAAALKQFCITKTCRGCTSEGVTACDMSFRGRVTRRSQQADNAGR